MLVRRAGENVDEPPRLGHARAMTDVVIVGAGLAGLTAALRLQQAGFTTRILERYGQAGGLARALAVGGEPLEAFYHHIFTTDTSCVALVEELGLGRDLEWLPSRMGIWTDDRLWDFGTPWSLLRFRPMSLVDKVRFVRTTLALQRTHDPTPFEEVTAAEWLRRHQGETAWRSVWAPLLAQKFAHRADEVAMVWLWGKIHLRGRSRSRSGLGERLGYLRGSFGRLVDALHQRVVELGAEVELGRPVERIERSDRGFRLLTRRGPVEAAVVVAATQIPDYLAIAGHLLAEPERRQVTSLESTSAMCTILELDRSLTPYYWLNVADHTMPFGGLIEHTNFVPPERYGGRRILYISNYLPPGHPLLKATKAEVLASYLPALERVNPAFSPDWITASHHVRAEAAQPVVTCGYRARIPPMPTSVPGLYLCTMAQIYPEDRGMNYAIAYGAKVAAAVVRDRVV